MCQKNQAVKIFPAPLTVKSKKKRSSGKSKDTAGYYQCLFNSSLQGFNGQRITTACRNCKQNSQDLNSLRNNQIQQLLDAYQQMGDNLRNILNPLAHD